MAKRTPRTPKKDWQPAFLKALAAAHTVADACFKAKVGRRTVYDYRKTDVEFAAAWDEALEVGTEVMEAEAHRRAFQGTLKPVYQGGKKVGTVREYSDTLTIFLLKARKPEKYRDRSSVEHSGSLVQTHVYLPPKNDPPT